MFLLFLDDFPNPRITEDPKTHVALKGGNATLNCKAVSSSHVKMTIQWKKDNLDLQGRNITNFARSLNGKGTEHDSVLFLTNISDSDTGKYQCVASNNYGTTYSQKAKISVLSMYVWMLLICMFCVFIKCLLCEVE